MSCIGLGAKTTSWDSLSCRRWPSCWGGRGGHSQPPSQPLSSGRWRLGPGPGWRTAEPPWGASAGWRMGTAPLSGSRKIFNLCPIYCQLLQLSKLPYKLFPDTFVLWHLATFQWTKSNSFYKLRIEINRENFRNLKEVLSHPMSPPTWFWSIVVGSWGGGSNGLDRTGSVVYKCSLDLVE